jgi:predicted ester cyclase
VSSLGKYQVAREEVVEGVTMSTDENKELVRRQFDDIWNGANWAAVDELFARDYVNHDPYNPDQPTGPQGFRQRVESYRSVLSNFDLRVEQQVAEGDMVETHWSLRGIHAGALEGVDPTGNPVHVDGQLLSRIVEGKFVEEWVHWDTLGLLRQIGAVPAPTT